MTQDANAASVVCSASCTGTLPIAGTCVIDNAVCIFNVPIAVGSTGTFIIQNNATVMLNGTVNGSVGMIINGSLNINNASNITNGFNLIASGNDSRYYLHVLQGATLKMTDSVLEKAGWSIAAGQRGLEIDGTLANFTNDTLQNNQVDITLRSSDAVISQSTFTGEARANWRIMLEDLTNVTIINNQITKKDGMDLSTTVFGIYCYQNCSNLTVQNNFLNITESGSAPTDIAAIALTQSTTNGTIVGNTLYINGPEVDGIHLASGAKQSNVIGNMIYGERGSSSATGIILTSGANQTYIMNNTIVSLDIGATVDDRIGMRIATFFNTVQNNSMHNQGTAILVGGGNNNFTNNSINATSGMTISFISGNNNVWLNHFVRGGISDSGANNNFCLFGEGNFYEEHLSAGGIGGNDCGQAKIVRLEDSSCSPYYFRAYWERQSAFLPVGYDLYAVNNETGGQFFLGTSNKLNSSWIDSAQIPGDNYTLKLVPFIFEKYGRVNGTNNFTMNGSELCFSPDCKRPHVFKQKPEPSLTWPLGQPIWINATVTDNIAISNVSVNITNPSGILTTMRLLPPMNPQKDHLVEYDYRNSSTLTLGSGIIELFINEWLNKSAYVFVQQGGNQTLTINANFSLNTTCIPFLNFSFAYTNFQDAGGWDLLTTNISVFNYSNNRYQLIDTNATNFELDSPTDVFHCHVVKLSVPLHPDFLSAGVSNLSLDIRTTDHDNNNNPRSILDSNCEGEIVPAPQAMDTGFVWARIHPGHIYRGLYNTTILTGIYNVSYFANDTSDNSNNVVKTNFTV